MTQQLAGLGERELTLAFLVFLRVGAMTALLPVFGERVVPLRVRLVSALVLTAIVTPGVMQDPPDGTLVLAGLGEVVSGLLFGMILRLTVVALQIAGGIAANVTSLSQIFGGTVSDPQPAIATFLVLAGLSAAAHSGLHVHIVLVILESYDLLPPGTLPSGSDVAATVTEQASRGFRLAFSLAAPFVIASMIYNLALGAINRAMPQLMVAFVGAPAITLGALLLLFLSVPAMLSVWLQALLALLEAPLAP